MHLDGLVLAFLDDHSSLEESVKYLRTGYASSQNHVIFDDIFQTIFSSGET